MSLQLKKLLNLKKIKKVDLSQSIKLFNSNPKLAVYVIFAIA